MDLEEWEVLPRDASFFDFHGDGGRKRVSSSPSRVSSFPPPSSNLSNDFDMNYFICPSSPPAKPGSISAPSHLIPFELGPGSGFHPNPVEEQPKAAIFTGSVADASDQDSVSQVFFKKMTENEFVDIKMDSPKSPTSASSVLGSPKFGSGKFSFDDGGDLSNCSSPRIRNGGGDLGSAEEEIDGGGGLNDLWKWSLHGIGAICSFGFAAATVCIIIFGNHQRNKQQQKQLRFQIFTDDKRVQQVVQHATRFNDAISAVRGVPIARAQVTFGGYYDAI